VRSREGLNGFKEEQISYSYRDSTQDHPARSQATSYSTIYDPKASQNKLEDSQCRSEHMQPIVWFRISAGLQHSYYFVVPNYRLCILLTPWSRVLLKKLTGSQLVKKFPAFYGTRSFFTAFTSARHLSLSTASPIQSISPQLTS
jgi:hypothetical protein